MVRKKTRLARPQPFIKRERERQTREVRDLQDSVLDLLRRPEVKGVCLSYRDRETFVSCFHAWETDLEETFSLLFPESESYWYSWETEESVSDLEVSYDSRVYYNLGQGSRWNRPQDL